MRIKDIARIANVSPATVSLVINDKPGVSDDTRRKIFDIVNQHGYSVSNVVKTERINQGNIRFLKCKKYGTIVDENGGFITSVIDGLDMEARKLGYNVVMTTFNMDNSDEVLEIVKKDPCKGIILLGTELDNSDIEFLNDIEVPVVIIDNLFEFEEYDSVVMNNQDGAFKAVKHLVDLGFTDIGYFHSSIDINNFSAREEGYKKALEKFNIEYKAESTFYLEPSMEGSYRDMKNIMKKSKALPKAVFSDNDTIAIGAIKALKEFGVKIPKDISIIGFDDIPFCLMINPPLSTMKIYKEQIGSTAVRRIHQKIMYNDKTVCKVQIGAKFIKRGSTCRAK